MDVSAYYNGFHADLNETFLVGKVDEKSLRLVKTAYECLMQAVAVCKKNWKMRTRLGFHSRFVSLIIAQILNLILFFFCFSAWQANQA